MHLHTARIIILICYVQDYLAHFIHFYDIVQIDSAHFAVTLSILMRRFPCMICMTPICMHLQDV